MDVVNFDSVISGYNRQADVVMSLLVGGNHVRSTENSPAGLKGRWRWFPPPSELGREQIDSTAGRKASSSFISISRVDNSRQQGMGRRVHNSSGQLHPLPIPPHRVWNGWHLWAMAVNRRTRSTATRS
jgi:hypothetical protein